MALFAGGYKNFGPTYNSTKYVRFGHEGTVNSMHFVDPALVPAVPENIDIDRTNADGELINGALAGKIAAYVTGEDGETYVGLCDTAKQPAGLIVDDLGDIANASNKISFYFRGGEYYISVSRLGDGIPTNTQANDEDEDPASDGDGDEPTTTSDWSAVAPGTPLYVDANGCLTTVESASKVVVGIVSAPAAIFTQGNMYENAGEKANGGLFVGVELRI